MIGIECSQKPTTPSADDRDLDELQPRATIALSKRSAIWPPRPDRKKNGADEDRAPSA